MWSRSWGEGELGEVQGGETMTRIYDMKQESTLRKHNSKIY